MGERAVCFLGLLLLVSLACQPAWADEPRPREQPRGRSVPLSVVPDVGGLRESQARKLIVAAGLRARVTHETRACQDRGQARRVMWQNPAPGASLPAKSWVDLRVCNRQAVGALVEVPDLVGLELAQAQALLQSAGLRARLNRRSHCPSPGRMGQVLSQSPPAGERVQAGLLVILNVCPAP